MPLVPALVSLARDAVRWGGPVLLLGGLAGQGAPARAAQHPDPYTGGEAKKLAGAGYVAVGRFAWAPGRTTEDVMFAVGDPKICWIETKHFKLGCAIAPKPMKGRSDRRKLLLAELGRLRKRLPSAPRRPRTLDRWLLAHLYAYRIEAVYRGFLRQIRCAALPRFQRAGAEKFQVVLFDRKLQVKRYLEYLKVPYAREAPRRYLLGKGDTVGFTTASDCIQGQLYDQVLMHAHLASEIVKNIVAGYGESCMRVPHWFSEGLGLVTRRAIVPRANFFSEDIDPQRSLPHHWKWADRVRDRIKKDYWLKSDEIFRMGAVTDWKIQHHLMAWSRVDYLLAKQPTKFQALLSRFHKRHMAGLSGLAMDFQHEVVKDVFGLDSAAFDNRWRAFAKSRRAP